MHELMQAALALAERQMVVFPLGRLRKVPLIREWHERATTDMEQVRRWWTDSPGANIGLVCGRSGLLVVDLDVKNGLDGPAVWRDLCRQLGIDADQLDTVRVSTPSGGQHLYFAAPPDVELRNTVGQLGKGIDTRANGGYVVAPPSATEDGPYVWNGGKEIRPLPSALVRALTGPRALLAAPQAVVSSEPISNVKAEQVVRDELNNVRRAPEGTRNNTLNRAAFMLGQLVAAPWAGLARLDVERGLLDAAAACGLGEREALATIASGLEAGMTHPRPAPNPTVGAMVGEKVPAVAPTAQSELLSNAGRCPDLPEYARLMPEQCAAAATAGRWVDDYVAFAGRASPMTPKPFHTAVALFLGGLAIARRLYLPVSVDMNAIYPNLYMLYVGPSTIQRKSTALRVARNLLRQADMEYFMLADQQTPEAMALDLSTRIPSTFQEWQPEVRARWLQERCLTAQRGWLLEEAAKLLESFNREFTAGLLPMVLDLYDCPPEALTRNTLARGRELVKLPYLMIYGVTTYGDMAEHFGSRRLWANGFFARFALVGSDDVGAWRFWPPPCSFPPDLIQRLQRLATQLLPMPMAYITEMETDSTEDNVQSNKQVQLSTPLACHPVTLERDGEAWQAWERYARATSYDMLKDHLVDDKCIPSYGRLGTMLIKIAIILAALDAQTLPVAIEPRHVYRAQEIVEGWRENLHKLMVHLNSTEEDKLEQRILETLAKRGTEWTSQRDLTRALTAKTSEIEPLLRSLVADARIEMQQRNNSNKSTTVYYRLALSE